jgi:methyl coenzyme M reductase alpha subunit
MPKSFWIIVGAVFFVQYNLAAYFDNLNDTIVKRFQIPYVNAGYLMFIPYGLSVIFSFILGKIL